jgi:hypothetical protein
MPTTVDQTIVQLLASREDIRDFVGGIVVVVLIASLVELEILRHRQDLPEQRRSIAAMAAVLGIAWVTMVTERLVALL